ncbi:MAG: DsbA family protein [Alkalibacterium sp.]|nr:DsbA family protein [Alkalibacterium sp.]MDN6294557.1 DsbA family protein [Alkalibacterium sp.]MDN6728896.1 DsbA family protein [Alkalibacterium sp.]
MDTSGIESEKVTTKGGIAIGSDTAPVKIIEFINLRCPYSKQWFEKSITILDAYVKENKVQRIIKHFDKEKPGLKKGNVLHRYLNHSNPEQAKDDIAFYYAHLDEWGDLSEEEIANYAKEKRKATLHDNKEHVEAILEETREANVTTVPTVFINDAIFDQKIAEKELEELIEEGLA